METRKQSRAERMAATYGEVLIGAGVIKKKLREVTPIPMLDNQVNRGEVNWWMVCLGQHPATKE